ncbi:hypothetical protein IZY60_09945 [Lutibacter sp. B2]|nr:hypothetical protein [Lutibacter sp. B2]
MEWIIIVVSLILTIIFNYMFYKKEHLNPLKNYVYKLFWVNEIGNLEKDHKFAYRFLNLGVKFFMYPYVVFSSYVVITSLLTLNIVLLGSAILMMLIYPLMYRLVMGLQRKIHGL